VTGAQIDTRTFAVTAGAGHPATTLARPSARVRPITPGSCGVPWVLIALIVAALGGWVSRQDLPGLGA
jgi:hypothetical protein